jgi:hypothetical protein
MADPVTIGTIALVSGTALSATSQIMRGRAEAQAAAFEAEQLKVQEQMTRTAAQQEEARRREELTANLETIQAIRAGRGVGEASPTAMAIFDSVTEDEERDIGIARFNYLQRADLARRSAELAGGRARTSLLSGYLGAGATVADAGFRYGRIKGPA